MDTERAKEEIESARNLLSDHYEMAEDTTTKQIIEMALDSLALALKNLIPKVEKVAA